MEIAVLNIAGQETGKKVSLNDSIFAVETNEHAIYLDVKQYLANQRQGTHKSKERGEISGSTAKKKKQKGTGTARCGSIKSPIFRGGGRVFGPRPRNYGFKLNKKLKQVARKSALTLKAQSDMIFVLEDFSFETPKTKQMIELKNNVRKDYKKVLIVLSEENNNIYLSSRNIKNVNIVTVEELNTYSIMNSTSVIFAESAVAKLDELFKLA